MDKATLTALVEELYETDVDFPGSLGSTRGVTLLKRSRKPTLKKATSTKGVKKSGAATKKSRSRRMRRRSMETSIGFKDGFPARTVSR